MPRAPSRSVASPRAVRRARERVIPRVMMDDDVAPSTSRASDVDARASATATRAHWYDGLRSGDVPREIRGAHGADAMISRGPHARAAEATRALRSLALAEGRGIRQCKRTTQGKRIVWLCRDAADAGGSEGVGASGRCGYRAVVRRRTGTRGGADGSWWIAEYAPHDANCSSTPKMDSMAIARDPVIAEAVRVRDLRGRRLRELVKETLGVDLPARTAHRVRHRAKDVDDASSDRV